MSFDNSRVTFDAWKDFLGVVMQQGRVQLDADWNEWVAQVARRIQAGALDTFGRAVVPRETPEAFNVKAAGGVLTVGRGRIYVDGLLAENHGIGEARWDPALAELIGTEPTPFFAQPYLPFNADDSEPEPAPAAVFNRPELSGGPRLVYLDVWQREVTHLQEPRLIEQAVGVDTTGRLQTVWQVKVLADIDSATCATPDGEVPGWTELTRPSAGRLTNSTGEVPDDPYPCQVPPAAGYTGLENQLYRVEIHRGGGQGSATFKWSRDNAAVATRVLEIRGGSRLVVESLGRDEVLGFHAGDWIEILDDWHELHGRTGQLRRVRPGDGVDTATHSILLEHALPDGLFPVDAQGRTNPTRHTRIRRWDQSGVVRRADGSAFHDLNLSASSDGIPLPPPDTRVALESGILVQFDVDPAGGEYRAGDYWMFAARVADGSIEPLEHAPPRGIHHHYARLAIVTLPDTAFDCRVFWPPAAKGESCDCTVCVHPDGHNAGTATIQQAVDSIRTRGGTICLDAGTYRLDAKLKLEGVKSLRIRGQGWLTLIEGPKGGSALDITQSAGVAIENLTVLGSTAGEGPSALLEARNCVDLQLTHLVLVNLAAGKTISAAVGLAGLMLGGVIRDCALVAVRGITALAGRQEIPYLLTAKCRVTDNVFLCKRQGLSLEGMSLHYGELRLSGNHFLGCAEAGIVTTGGALPGASIAIANNVMQVGGAGVVAGVDGLRVVDNEIVASSKTPADGIVLKAGLDRGAIDGALITGNRIRGFQGNGLAIRHPLGRAMIKSNQIDNVRLGALAMEGKAGAAYLCLENNHFADLGVGFLEGDPYFGVHLRNVTRCDCIDNLFARVARTAEKSHPRAALMAVATDELRIAGNRMFGIGPPRPFRATFGIAVSTPFRCLEVEGNSIARIADPGESPDPAHWQAIVVAPIAAVKDSAATAAAGEVIVSLPNGYLILSNFWVRFLPNQGRGNTTVRDNRLRGSSTSAPLVEIENVLSCLLVQNDAEIAGSIGRFPAPPVARITCDHASVANNRLVGIGEVPALQLAPNSIRVSVLGNLVGGRIMVGDGDLPEPWKALNVTI